MMDMPVHLWWETVCKIGSLVKMILEAEFSVVYQWVTSDGIKRDMEICLSRLSRLWDWSESDLGS